ncbi:MAG: hypothetical protein CXZ00_03010 [Acidobacteria bacterium]|nr:MAG: hypothetical protein CXZ00_03010 [Acidobacteriota bacterium]
MPKIKVIRIANPYKKVSRKRRPNLRKKHNPGPLGGVLTIMSNPRKKNTHKRNPFKAAARKVSRRRKNPTIVKTHRRKARRNPYTVLGQKPSQIMTLALSAGAGAIGTRFVTQLVLRSKNEGVYGYGGNIVAAIGLGMGGAKMLGPDAGMAILAGGLAATVQRFWDDKVSKVLPAVSTAATGAPAGTTVKGLGDVSYSDDGLGRAVALGSYNNVTWPYTQEGGIYTAPPAAGSSAPVALPSAGSKPVTKPAW